jgi:hypothetical protein
LEKLGKSPTASKFQPVPIHVGNTDEMMRGMDNDICPFQSELRHKFAGTDDWKALNKHYMENLFPEMSKNFNIPLNSIDFSSVYPYIDNYYSAHFDDMTIPKDLSKDGQAEVDNILRDGLYEGFFGLDLAVRLTTSRFFNFLHTTLENKILALEKKDGVPAFY